MTPDEERDRIILALDQALDDAHGFGKGDYDEFRELVKHCREIHDVLLAAIKRHPAIHASDLDHYVSTTRASIPELELLAGVSSISRH
jgi:hypothetical protein